MGFRGKLSLIVFPIIAAYLCFSGPKFDPSSIRGKRVLVTGASSGIGEQVAYYYAELGAHLVITARRTDLLEKVAQKCKEIGAQSVHSFTADMSSPVDRKKLVQETEEQLKGLDHLILNHALLVKLALWKNSAQNMTLLEQVMNVNFMSYVDISSQLIGLLEKSKGNIGVVSSAAGKVGIFGGTQYGASKHALQGFYATLRQELRMADSGVSVTVIVYGPIDTENVAKLMDESAPKMNFKDDAADAREAAIALVEGVSNRVYEAYFPVSFKLGTWLAALMPETIEGFMAGMLKDVVIA